MPPLVSVVIPAFNAGGYLCESVKSALSQTIREIEVVVVDDGSSEPLPELPDDQRLRVIAQSNQGVSVARNRGFRETSASLIAFLDADDRWRPEKLEKQLAAMAEAPTALLSYTEFVHIGSRGEPLGAGAVSYGSGYAAVLAKCAIPMSSVVIRREVLEESGGFDPFYSIMQDWDLWLRLASEGNFLPVREPLVEYRVAPHNRGQLSGNPTIAFLETESIYDRHELRATRGGDAETLKLIRAGRSRARRLRATQAAHRSVAFRDWSMLVSALRISASVTVVALVRACWRRFAEVGGTRHNNFRD